MKHIILMTLLALTGLSAQAKKTCTDQPKDKWMTEGDFKKKVEGMGYKISKFKQPGSCYEIYGVNKNGKKVEVYFNPVDATITKEEID
ncbi:MAG: PepSY domain-containing protein [Pseudobdellovibrionaceae bacterium]